MLSPRQILIVKRDLDGTYIDLLDNYELRADKKKAYLTT